MNDGANKQADCTVLTGSNLDHLPTFADCTFDSCVTDPPYELGFMGKAWDKSGIAYSVDMWREVYRVLKPGAYLLAFGGSRTYHRMACAIEDAGFEIRDQIQWIYGSGFPKSLDVSKAIDKAAGAERKALGITSAPNGKAGGYEGERYKEKRQTAFGVVQDQPEKSEPATEEARTWNGWGTALKPAHEPIVMARKPLEKGLTVAQNVLKWGTGAINVDGCRIETDDLLGGGAENPDTNAVMKADGWDRPWMHDDAAREAHSARVRDNVQKAQSLGRFPANVIHDGSDEVVERFPEQISGANPTSRNSAKFKNAYGEFAGQEECVAARGAESGTAARFFYTAKASKYDREAGLPEAGRGVGALRDGNRDNTMPARNHHPTVKPTDLMQYLCRLVTPPGGLILDPFLGSGSTAKAALIERFRVVGIELNPEYAAIADARCKSLQVKLF